MRWLARLGLGAGFWLSAASAQTGNDPSLFTIQSWRTSDGLPQNSVQCIVHATDGYLWLGTEGGLARFDGVRFTTYGLAEGLKGLDISVLLDNGSGGLWVGTHGGGLSHGRNGVFTTLRTTEGLAHDSVFALAPAKQGGVWVGTRHGLQRWSGGGFIHIGEAEGLSRGEVTALEMGKDGRLWVSMAETGLFRQREGRFEPVLGPSGKSFVRGYLLLEEDGSLWVSIGNGRIFRLRSGNWTEFNTTNGVPISAVGSLAQGFQGQVWAGSLEGGLHVFREGKFRAIATRTGELDPAIRSVQVDRDGVVWVGTRSGGLSRLTPTRLTAHPIARPGHGGQVNGLVEEPPGRYWVTTYGGGLLQGPMEGLEPVRGPKELRDSPFLSSGICLSDQTLWFFGYWLLLQKPRGASALKAIKTTEHWTSACQGADGALWLGTMKGELWRMGEGSPQAVTNGTFPAAISALAAEPGPVLWIATLGAGLFRWEAGAVRRWHRVEEGLPAAVLHTLHRDADGTLWIGTAGGGLAWLREGRLHSVNTRHGLGDNIISQILEDDHENLWLGCHRGIFRVSKHELADVAAGRAEAVHPLALGEGDGMPTAECTGRYSPAGLRTRSGNLLFSTPRGVVHVDPTQFGAVPPPPPVLIEEVLRDGKLVERRFSFGPNAERPLETGHAPRAGRQVLTLSPGPRELEIRDTAFNYSKPEQIRFRHRLKGLATEWTDVGAQRLARFTLLPPGDYTFQVSAANEDGRWPDIGASIDFLVRPFFWQTTWFRVAVGLFLMGTGGGVVASIARSRIRRLQTGERLARADMEIQQHRNEVAHLTRVATLGELSSALAHELNQPLTAILSNAQAAQRFLAQGQSDSAEFREILQDIVADDQRASEVIRRLHTLLKKGQFQPQALDANEVMRDVLRLMSGDLKGRAVSVVTELALNLPPVRGDRVQLQQVLINLVLNAGDAMAQTVVGARKLTLRSRRVEGGFIEISVADTGSGLAPGSEEKIFEPYHTTKAEGLGLGLSLSRSIIVAHGGRLWVENHPGRGATFCYTLPEWKGETQ